MRAWAKMHGKSVRKRNVRQDNTMDRAGTLPLNLYETETVLRDWSKSIGGGGVGRSREGVGHEVLNLVQGVGRAIFSYP